MGKIVVMCPGCRSKLSFDDFPGFRDALIKCPKCYFQAAVSVFMGGAPSGGGGKGPSEDTALPDTELVNSRQAPAAIGSIKVISSGESFKLREGSNVIGRRARTSTADLHIASDPYMSRIHVRIDVVKKGYGYEHHLVEINSKNIVKLNGRAIGRGDILLLKRGDRLILGTTEVIFEIPDSEETQIV